MARTSYDAVVSGLVRRGLPEHVAKGFAINYADESGFDAGVNEAKPVVPGSRGGFGLAQWTGPRRVAYEAFAASRGLPADDPETALDFTAYELATSEKGAARAIMSARDEREAAVAVLESYLRPAAEHREKRKAKYLGAPAYSPAAGAGGPELPQFANALAWRAPEQPRENALAMLPRFDFSTPEPYRMTGNALLRR